MTLADPYPRNHPKHPDYLADLEDRADAEAGK